MRIGIRRHASPTSQGGAPGTRSPRFVDRGTALASGAVFRVARLLLLASLLAAAPAGAAPSVGEPIVYVSPDGTLPETQPVEVPAADGQSLRLYIDYANDPDVMGSTSGFMCVDANGDETCGFDVRLEMTTDAATFGSFTPASGTAVIVGQVDPTGKQLRVNGIDTGGMSIPAEIGTLELNAATANQLQIAVTGMHRVGAAGQLDAIQDQVIVQLPEPGWAAQLGSGVVALAWLARRRRTRSAASEGPPS